MNIINTKGITADVLFATIKSTFTDYINIELKTKLEFEFSKIHKDTVAIKQPALNSKDIYLIIVSPEEILLTKTDETYQVPLFEEKLIAFIHIAAD